MGGLDLGRWDHTIQNSLRINFCTGCKAGISPVSLGSFVFALPRSSLLFILSPTLSKDSPSNTFLALVWRSSNRVSMSPEQEVARISSNIMAGLRAIGGRTTASTPGTSFCGKGTGLSSSSTSERPTSGTCDEVFANGSPDTHYMRRLLTDAGRGR